MAKHKIVSTNQNKESCDEVALNIVRKVDSGEDVVIISAWHTDDNEKEFYQESEIKFPCFGMCESFIDDFSTESADIFVLNFDF